MKKAINNLILCKPLKIMTIILLGMCGLFSSCLDEAPGLPSFPQEMMGQYLQNRKADFSEFSRLLDTTQVMGLVNAYGKYTLFAPDNDAMRAFYKSKEELL